MNNKINWWMIIGIVVVVAVIASLVTMQFTGNAINMANPDRNTCYSSCVTENCANMARTQLTSCKRTCSSDCSKVEVYTKAEVDSKINSLDEKINQLSLEIFPTDTTVLYAKERETQQVLCSDGESQISILVSSLSGGNANILVMRGSHSTTDNVYIGGTFNYETDPVLKLTVKDIALSQQEGVASYAILEVKC